jgi:Ca2+-binding EF-hand superfamily protein
VERSFRNIAKGNQENIIVSHLCDFLERHSGKGVPDSDVEAILRRVDHDGDM